MLSLYLGRDRLRIADVERLTGIHRNTLYRYYNDRMQLIDLEEVALLCRLFKLSSIGELFILREASGEAAAANVIAEANLRVSAPEASGKRKRVVDQRANGDMPGRAKSRPAARHLGSPTRRPSRTK